MVQTWLRGVQAADRDGKLGFTTIVPGCYPGRWPHIHFEVYPDHASATDNLAGIGSVEQDGIFADSIDLQIPTIAGSINSGYTATLTINVDTRTAPGSGGGGMGGGRG